MKPKQYIRMEIKQISEDGTFEGLLSPYGNVDAGGDVVEPGAFTKTLQEHGSTVPVLWQHRPDEPIGEMVLEDRPDGLYCKGRLLLQLPEAQKAYLLIKAGIVRGLSIGYKSIKDAIEAGIRHLKEIRLFEGSIVTFPMNEQAVITGVKGAGEFIAPYLDVLAKEYPEVEQWAQSRMEAKAGRTISAHTRECIKGACNHMDEARKSLTALIEDEAELEAEITSDPKAAAQPESAEPAIDHSRLISQLDELKGALIWK